MDAEEIVERWRDCTEKYGAALELFQVYLKRTRELEKQLDGMLNVNSPYPKEDVNKKLDEYSLLCAKIADVDEEIHRLYDLCVMIVDEAYKRTAEMRLPRLMLAFANAKRELANSLFDTR